MDGFEKALLARRSVYSLNSALPIGDEELKNLLEGVLLHAPTAFDMRNTRLVLLLGEESKKLWNIVLETLRQKMGGKIAESTESKLAMFAAGYGTILYFNDKAVTQQYMDENPTYKDNFDPWDYQHSGMLQYAVWTALADAGIGASLQHYNPLIDDEVKATWHLQDTWMLLAQMPFGSIARPAGQKDRGKPEGRFLVFPG